MSSCIVVLVATCVGVVVGAAMGREIGDDWLVLVFSLGGGLVGALLGLILTGASWALA